MPGKVLLFSQQSSLGQSRRRGMVVRPSKSANSTRPKPDWSPYLTPDGQYSLSKEEQLRRKQLAISKHNVLLGSVVPSREMRTFKNIAMGTVKQSPKKLVETSKDDSAEKSSSTSKDLTSLDLLSPIATPSKAKPYELETTLDWGLPPIREEGEGDKENRFPASSRANSKDLSAFGSRRLPLREYEAEDDDEDEDEHFVDVDDEEEDEEEAVIEASSLRRSARPKSAPSSSSSAPKPVAPKRIPAAPRPKSAADASRASTRSRRRAPASASSRETEAEADPELAEMAAALRTLGGELRFYEEISGKRRVLSDDDDFETALGEAVQPTQKQVMRSLVQLVCRTMTYLLQSEVEGSSHKLNYKGLEEKVDTLTGLLLPHSADVFSASASAALGRAVPPPLPMPYHASQEATRAVRPPIAPVHPSSSSSSFAAGAGAEMGAFALESPPAPLPSFPDLSPVRPVASTPSSRAAPASTPAPAALAIDVSMHQQMTGSSTTDLLFASASASASASGARGAGLGGLSMRLFSESDQFVMPHAHSSTATSSLSIPVPATPPAASTPASRARAQAEAADAYAAYLRAKKNTSSSSFSSAAASVTSGVDRLSSFSASTPSDSPASVRSRNRQGQNASASPSASTYDPSKYGAALASASYANRMAELGLALGTGTDGGNSLLGEASYGSSFAEPPKPQAAPQHPFRP